MAVHDLSPEPAADAHPLANPGYGKRSAPEQLPRTASDFVHLPAREASIAAYLDRLPDGADVSVKTLAKVLPYGQCALRAALRRLSEAGHLRRVREHLLGDGTQHWVTRTYFTRTARDDAWWASFRAGGGGVPSRGVREAEPPRRREPAFEVLAGLGRRDARMTLSAAACAALAPLAGRWLKRGVTPEGLGLAQTEITVRSTCGC
ncbi:hypothetical protein [Streptomyces sp. WMMC1477]|uniref:hypothetical protein n=1 Tax=Streptomyces sp. WMMC1477 TaxID=3015155 RepID=UPI002FC36503